MKAEKGTGRGNRKGQYLLFQPYSDTGLMFLYFSQALLGTVAVYSRLHHRNDATCQQLENYTRLSSVPHQLTHDPVFASSMFNPPEFASHTHLMDCMCKANPAEAPGLAYTQQIPQTLRRE